MEDPVVSLWLTVRALWRGAAKEVDQRVHLAQGVSLRMVMSMAPVVLAERAAKTLETQVVLDRMAVLEEVVVDQSTPDHLVLAEMVIQPSSPEEVARQVATLPGKGARSLMLL